MDKFFAVKFESNYADEFDCEILWVMTEEERDMMYSTLSDYFFDEDEPEEPKRVAFLYFGSNEALEFGSLEELQDCFSSKEISPMTYIEMKAFIGERGVGTGPFFCYYTVEEEDFLPLEE